jgi:hypothetical protein
MLPGARTSKSIYVFMLAILASQPAACDRVGAPALQRGFDHQPSEFYGKIAGMLELGGHLFWPVTGAVAAPSRILHNLSRHRACWVSCE